MSQGPKMKSLENQLLKGNQGRGSPEGKRQRMAERCRAHHKVSNHRNLGRRVKKRSNNVLKERDVMNAS